MTADSFLALFASLAVGMLLCGLIAAWFAAQKRIDERKEK